MSVWYGPRAAVTPGDAAGSSIESVRDVDVEFYDPADTDFTTKLTVEDVNHLSTNKMHVGDDAILPGFWGPDSGIVIAWAGGWSTPVEAISGMRDKAEAAAADAAQSADNAASAAADAATAQAAVDAAKVPTTDQASGRVLTALSGTAGDWAWRNPTGGGGTSSGFLVLGPGDDVPGGTLAGTPIFRVGGITPAPSAAQVITTGATSTGSFGGGPNDLDLPSGVEVGDVVVVAMVCQGNISGATVGDFTKVAWDNLSSRGIGLFVYPVPDSAALAGLSAPTITLDAPTSGRWSAVGFRVTGVSTDSPFMVASDLKYGDTATITTEEASAGAGAALVLSVSITNNSAGSPVAAIASRTASNGATVNAGPSHNSVDSSGGGTAVFVDWLPFTGTSVPTVTTTFSPASQGTLVGGTYTLKGA